VTVVEEAVPPPSASVPSGTTGSTPEAVVYLPPSVVVSEETAPPPTAYLVDTVPSPSDQTPQETVTPPTAILNAAPQEELTASPVASPVVPTPSQTDSPVAFEKPKNELWVYADPVTVEASGPFDLETAKQVFFDTTMSVIQEYFQSFLGGLLEQFNMDITFLDSDSAVLPFGVTGSTVLVKSYFVVNIDFKVASEEMDILVEFSKVRATELVGSFFTGYPAEQLLEALYYEGIGLDEVRVVEMGVTDDADKETADDTESDQVDDEDEDIPIMPDDPEDEASTDGEPGVEVSNTGSSDSESQPEGNDGGPNTSLIAGIVSGLVIVIALIAVVYSSRRRNRKWFNDALESVSGSLYSDGLGPPDGKVLPVLTSKGTSTTITGRTSISQSLSSASSKSRIKPAAITQRNSNTRPIRSQGSVSTLGSFNMTLNPVIEKTGFEEDEHSEERSQDDSALRMENGPDLVAAATLSCLDGTSSVNGMVENYPEFDLYSGVPHSSTWSVDGLTIDDEEENRQIREQEANRRRWREEADALVRRTVPGYYESGSSDTKSSDFVSDLD